MRWKNKALCASLVLSLLLSVSCGNSSEAGSDSATGETSVTEAPETGTSTTSDSTAAETTKPPSTESTAPTETTTAPDETTSRPTETTKPTETKPPQSAETTAQKPADETKPPETSAAQDKAEPDENKIMRVDDGLYYAPGTYSEKSVQRFIKKLNTMRDKYFSENKVVCALIPDKSYYVKDRVSEFIDHQQLSDAVAEGLSGWTCLDLAETLTLGDFYRTDSHWRQEKLLPVLGKLGEALGVEYSDSLDDYTLHERENLIGINGKNEADVKPETYCWLTNSAIDSAKVWDFEKKNVKIYDESKLDSENPYDMFMSGIAAYQILENTANTSGKVLILFRDSYGASISPLLLEAYSRVILIDLRYMMSDVLPQYIDFSGADILFLFSDRIINNSILLK